jgi:DNA sulfur modification protein DndE
MMLPSRVKIPADLTDVLKQLKGRTGITPNILCRIALVLSLREGRRDTHQPKDLDGLEFNLSTLFGEHLGLYECLIRQVYGELEVPRTEQLLAQHISDGLMRIRAARSVSDLAEMR